MAGTWVFTTLRGRPITSSANATFSYTVLLVRSLKSWKTEPMLRRRYGTFHDDSVAMSLPATKIRPCSGDSSLFTRRRNVDLPEPDAPTRKTNSPFSTSTVASLSATTSPL